MKVAPKTASRPQIPNHRAGSESRAENIVITVTLEYRPEHSNPADERFVYAYRVVVENTNSYPVKLIARRWEIIDSELIFLEGIGRIGQVHAQNKVQIEGFLSKVFGAIVRETHRFY